MFPAGQQWQQSSYDRVMIEQFILITYNHDDNLLFYTLQYLYVFSNFFHGQ